MHGTKKNCRSAWRPLAPLFVATAFLAISPVLTEASPVLYQQDFSSIPAFARDVTQHEGVAGSAAFFNGYTSEWSEKWNALEVFNNAAGDKNTAAGDTLFVEAWVCPQEYSFNANAIVNQLEGDWRGLYLGVTANGNIAAVLHTGDKKQVLYSKQELPLLRWSHVALAYKKGEGAKLFINGELSTELAFAKPAVFAPNAPLTIGRCQIKQHPLHTHPGNKKEIHKEWLRFTGLIDELRITTEIPAPAVLAKKIAATGKVGKQQLRFPPMPGGDIKQGAFGAFQTKLKYDAGWDAAWRVAGAPDIVVRFPNLPHKFVFWRGTSYVPAVVTENNIWVTDQCLENCDGLGECYEALSDKQCRFSNVRILENTPARCVVHWRYALSNVTNKIALENNDGWGEWADEFWTIYPDGVAARKQILHSPNSYKGHVPYEFDEILPLNAAGTKTEDNLELKALTLCDLDGNATTYDWARKPPQKYDSPRRHPISLVNTKSRHKPFFIFHQNRVTAPWRAKSVDGKSNFSCWSHWPLAQIKSASVDAVRADKMTCTALDCTPFDGRTRNRFLEVEFGPNNTTLYRSLAGTTTGDAQSLVPLARSWNFPPPLELSANARAAGWQNKGYDKYQRA
ncbi:MAG: LamG domain-containing protein, partial [Puniceicoccales bacterium]|nr:LamG domain-containing protein [Puniceicoccales bacterium]